MSVLDGFVAYEFLRMSLVVISLIKRKRAGDSRRSRPTNSSRITKQRSESPLKKP